MEKEIWKPIKGYEGSYEVSNFGKIKSFPKGNRNKVRILKTRLDKYGYERLKLSKNGVITDVTIHRIVCTTFIENTLNKKCVNHVDGNKRNNHSNNLEWVTTEENSAHASKTNLYSIGESCKSSKLKEEDVLAIRKKYSEGNISYKKLGGFYGLTPSAIAKIILRKSWKHIRG